VFAFSYKEFFSTRIAGGFLFRTFRAQLTKVGIRWRPSLRKTHPTGPPSMHTGRAFANARGQETDEVILVLM
jgi:hypothetical protein